MTTSSKLEPSLIVSLLILFGLIIFFVLYIIRIPDEEEKNQLIPDNQEMMVDGNLEAQIQQAPKIARGEQVNLKEGDIVTLADTDDMVRLEFVGFNSEGGVDYELWVNDEQFLYYADLEEPKFAKYTVYVGRIDQDTMTATFSVQ